MTVLMELEAAQQKINALEAKATSLAEKAYSLEQELVTSWKDHEVLFFTAFAFGLGLFSAHLFGL